MSGRDRVAINSLFPHTYSTSRHHHPTAKAAFVTADEPARTSHHSPEPPVHTRYGLDVVHPMAVWTNVPTIAASCRAALLPREPSVPHQSMLATQPVNHSFFYCPMVLPFPECHLVGIQYVAFPDGLLSLSDMH